MPSKYSHAVVLAHYSSRGLINVPSDQHALSAGYPATTRSVEHLTEATPPFNKSTTSPNLARPDSTRRLQHYGELLATGDQSSRRRDHNRRSHLVILDSSSEGENETENDTASVKSIEPSLVSVSTRVTSCAPETPRSATIPRASLSIDSTSSRGLERPTRHELEKQVEEAPVVSSLAKPTVNQVIVRPTAITPSEPVRDKRDNERRLSTRREPSRLKMNDRFATIDRLASNCRKSPNDLPTRDTGDAIRQHVLVSPNLLTRGPTSIQLAGATVSTVSRLQPAPRRQAVRQYSELHRKVSDLSVETSIYDPVPGNLDIGGPPNPNESRSLPTQQPRGSRPGSPATPRRERRVSIKCLATANPGSHEPVQPPPVSHLDLAEDRSNSLTSASSTVEIGALSVVRKAPSRPGTQGSTRASPAAWLPPIPGTPLSRGFDAELFDTDLAPTLHYSLVGVETTSGRRKLSLQREVILTTEAHFLLDDDSEAVFPPDITKHKMRDGPGSPPTQMEQLLREVGPGSRLGSRDGTRREAQARATSRDGRLVSSRRKGSTTAESIQEKRSLFARLRSKSMGRN